MTWAVSRGPAVELLRLLPAASIDAVVTDPPYGERAATWDTPRSTAWHEEWLLEVDRVLKPGGPVITFASRRYVDVVMGAMRRVFGDDPERPLQTGAWVHRQGHPVGDGMLRPEHEPFIVSGRLRITADDVRSLRTYHTPHNVQRKPTHRRENARGFKKFTYTPDAVGPIGGTVFEAARNKPGEATGHPTQKPGAVGDYLVRLACAPGGTVCDPFMGSGTFGEAALRHGCGFVGFDESAVYVELARRRLAGPLFAEATP